MLPEVQDDRVKDDRERPALLSKSLPPHPIGAPPTFTRMVTGPSHGLLTRQEWGTSG
jgi:hypothetical protein